MMRFWMALSVLVSSLALADAPAAAPTGREGVTPILPMVLIFGIVYLLILRPQNKKIKEQQKFISGLKRGDMVVTASGIIGTIRTVSDKFVTLEVDENVCIKVLRTQVAESATSLKEEKVVAAKEATT